MASYASATRAPRATAATRTIAMSGATELEPVPVTVMVRMAPT